MSKRILKVIVCVFLGLLAFGVITQFLWNRLMPELFGLKTVTFWQAVGLVILGKILLGGFHHHGGMGYSQQRRERQEWKRHMKARWAGMSPEERQRFRAAMKDKWDKSCGPQWMRDAAKWDSGVAGDRSDERKQSSEVNQ
ncbi:MAG: hypothetical protein PW735_11850 [Acidobacteriaceae bacterium]|nr:hypothetical protein [Acidobacteriaceae bacterium]